MRTFSTLITLYQSLKCCYTIKDWQHAHLFPSLLLNWGRRAKEPAAWLMPFGPADKHTGLEELALCGISYTSGK